MNTTDLSESSFSNLYSHDYYFEKQLFSQMKKVKKTYQDTICKSAPGEYCSNNMLASAQWYNGFVTKNPP